MLWMEPSVYDTKDHLLSYTPYPYEHIGTHRQFTPQNGRMSLDCFPKVFLNTLVYLSTL